jgi:hypothetical protein
MTAGLILAAVLAASQATGTPTPTSDVSHNRVKATGSTTARALRDRFSDVVNVRDFGAKGDGTTDDHDAIQDALDAASASFADVVVPPGSYRVSAQLVLTAPQFRRVVLRGYGAELVPDPGVSGLKITGGSSTGGATVLGLKVNHRGNATAPAGFEIVQAWRTRLVDCWVEAHGVSATYAGVLVRNGTASDPGTGSFWTRIENLAVRKRSGSDSGNIGYGIVLRGAANATVISGGNISNVVTGISIEVESGQTYLSNAVLVDGVAFEGYTTAVSVVGAATSTLAGHRFVHNRFENGTTVFSYTGITAQPSTPPFMTGNFFVSNAGTYLENPNSLYMNVWDMAITPAVTPSLAADNLAVRALAGSAWPLTLRVQGGGRGLQLQKSDGSQVGSWAWTSTGTTNETTLRSVSGGVANLHLNGVRSISGSGSTTEGHNLRGSATFTGAATKAVSFPTAEPDASYFVALSASANETFWVTGKGTGGFTLNSSNATSAATVDWIIVR